MIVFIRRFRKDRTIGMENRSVVARGWGCREGCSCTERAQGNLAGGAGTVLYPDCGGGYINLHIC